MIGGRKKRGKMLGGAPPRGGAWAGRTEGRPRHRTHASGTLLLVALGLLVAGATAGFGWEMDRQLRVGLLAQADTARARPDWVPLDRLPPHVPAAFVAVVDTSSSRFAAPHLEPADPRLADDLLGQVYRLGGGLRDAARRRALAPILEERMSGERQLELYLNRAYLGRAQGWTVFGLFHAAREYLGKRPEELTPGEAAALAGILLEPRVEEPAEHPGAVGVRRAEVLRRMRAMGLLDEEGFRRAAAEPLPFQPGADHAPMTRPLGWDEEPEVIRLPPAPLPDSAAPGATGGSAPGASRPPSGAGGR